MDSDYIIANYYAMGIIALRSTIKQEIISTDSNRTFIVTLNIHITQIHYSNSFFTKYRDSFVNLKNSIFEFFTFVPAAESDKSRKKRGI